MVDRDDIEDALGSLMIGFAAFVGVWAFLEGHLTPELVTDLLEIAADGFAELTDQ